MYKIETFEAAQNHNKNLLSTIEKLKTHGSIETEIVKEVRELEEMWNTGISEEEYIAETNRIWRTDPRTQLEVSTKIVANTIESIQKKLRKPDKESIEHEIRLKKYIRGDFELLKRENE